MNKLVSAGFGIDNKTDNKNETKLITQNKKPESMLGNLLGGPK